MPQRLLAPYVTMLPRLDAERRLVAIGDAPASNERSMEDGSRAQFLQQLESQAHGAYKPKKATRSVFANMGIVVVEEPAKPKGGD